MDKVMTIYFFPYVGGKARIASEIVSHYPPCSSFHTYVEPFCGGAHCFLSFDCPKTMIKVIVNDIDKDVFHLWRDIKVVKKDALVHKDWRGSRGLFDQLKKERVFPTPADRLYRNLYLSFYSFSGHKTGGYAHKKTLRGKGFFRTFDALKQKVSSIKVLNQDYKKVISKYDDPRAFFYIDPPYMDKQHLYGGSSINPLELYQVCRSIKGKFLLSYPDNPFVRHLFQEFILVPIPIRYTSGKDKPEADELLIKNY